MKENFASNNSQDFSKKFLVENFVNKICANKQNVFSISVDEEESLLKEKAKIFIRKKFHNSYLADVNISYPTIISVADLNGEIVAALGVRRAGDQKLFLENYLNESLEEHVSKIAGCKILRHEIVEIGNLAADGRNGIKALIVACAKYLKENGYRYLVSTGTNSLITHFVALGFDPKVICEANANKISNPLSWGTYYESQPKVIVGEVASSYARVMELFASQPSSLKVGGDV